MTRDARPHDLELRGAWRAVLLGLGMLASAACEEVPIGDDAGAPAGGDSGPPVPDPVGACVRASDCDDGNPCTADACSAGMCTQVGQAGGVCTWGICDFTGNCGKDPNAPCVGSSYEGQDLRASDLALLDLRCANLRGTNLEGVMLDGRDLWRADLTGAQLRGAHLAGADLREANLSRADLSYADLFGARTAGASFTGADLTGAR